MFTGLVQDIGVIEGVQRAAEAAQLSIATRLADRLRVGDSLAVDGVCLTVTEVGSRQVRATAVAETLERSTLRQVRAGQRVHLEPALRAGDALGGHIVQGHVDGVGRVVAAAQRGPSLELSLAAAAELMRYTVEKGSIAVDGVSLTIARLTAEQLTVALVPHTLQSTTFRDRRVGQPVNLEVDILAKYVERMLGAWRAGGPAGGQGPTAGGGMDLEWLRKHGFA